MTSTAEHRACFTLLTRPSHKQPLHSGSLCLAATCRSCALPKSAASGRFAILLLKTCTSAGLLLHFIHMGLALFLETEVAAHSARASVLAVLSAPLLSLTMLLPSHGICRSKLSVYCTVTDTKKSCHQPCCWSFSLAMRLLRLCGRGSYSCYELQTEFQNPNHRGGFMLLKYVLKRRPRMTPG